VCFRQEDNEGKTHKFQVKMSNVAKCVPKRIALKFWARPESADSFGKKQDKSLDDSGDLRTSSFSSWLRVLVHDWNPPQGDWA